MNFFQKYSYVLAILILSGCAGEADEPVNTPSNKAPLEIISPKNQDQFTVGDELQIEISVNDPSNVKNLQLIIDDSVYNSFVVAESQTFNISTEHFRVGFINIQFTYENASGEVHGDTRQVTFFSDIFPNQWVAVKQKEYPHDASSYTQGLEFYNGKLFEGTGRNGTSILAEVELNSGKIIRKKDLEARYFGEGITILNDTIYQLTWSEKTCFVYDMNFNPIKEFSYDGEGWGLCNDGTHLIMTNGSNEIVWRNRHTFAIEKRIQVFTDQQDVASLNELELINGSLFINVYTEDRIVEVDTATGKVLSDINCSAIALEGKSPGSDVLNGIAYNKQTGKIYITGKWWSKLYEVTFERRLVTQTADE